MTGLLHITEALSITQRPAVPEFWRPRAAPMAASALPLTHRL